MNKTNTLILCIVMSLFLISNVMAYSVSDIPNSISLKCGETYSRSFSFGEQINLTVGIMTSTDTIGYILGATPTTGNQVLHLSFFSEENYVCYAGKGKFTFEANNEDYEIWVNVTEDLWDLGVETLQEGEVLNVGGVGDFKLITSGETNAMYELNGCDEDLDDFLSVGDYVDATCEGESVRFWLEDSFPDLNAIRIKVFSSESGYALTKDGSSIGTDGDCILGLNTMGALVKRGNVFAIKTINVIDNKAVPGVSAMILDQTGELTPLEGVSSNTGFINSIRLHEDYESDMIVELEKEGCEPSTQIINFQQSYDDYVDEKETKENQKTLTISNIKEFYNLGVETFFTISNLLNESIGDATVKITNPEGVSNEVKTNTLGQFIFLPEVPGSWKFQISKMNHITSQLYDVNVKSAEYVLVKFVDDEEKNSFKINDKITFKIMDDNNTVIPLTFDAIYDDEPINFLDGISEEVVFKGKADLEIPEIGGCDANEITIRQKDNEWVKWILWIGGGFVILIVVVFIINKLGKGGTSSPKSKNPMVIPLPPSLD